MVTAIHRISFYVAALLLAGCALLQTSTSPREVSHNKAVVALLDKAHVQASAGQLEKAGASLERALRIEPRNPALWQELAHIRLDQRQYVEAENLAAKSNALLRGNKSMRAEYWRIIGQARTKRGDVKGAQAAFEKADR